MYLTGKKYCSTARNVRANLAKHTSGAEPTIVTSGYEARAVIVPLAKLPWHPTEADMRIYTRRAWHDLRTALAFLWHEAGVKMPKPKKQRAVKGVKKGGHLCVHKRDP